MKIWEKGSLDITLVMVETALDLQIELDIEPRTKP